MSVFTRTVEVVTQGSAGVASGSSRLNVGPARLLAVRLDYGATAPATTDVTVRTDRREAGDDWRNLLIRSNSNADGVFYPRVNAHKTDATTIPAGDNPYEPQVVHGYIEVLVNQCNAIDPALKATLYFEG